MKKLIIIPSVGLLRTLTVLLLTAYAVLLSPAFPLSASQVGSQELPTIKEKTAHMESQDGFIPIHYDPVEGRLYLEVLPGEEFFYNSFMATGTENALLRGELNWMACNAIMRFEFRGPDLVLLERGFSADLIDPTRTDLPAEARKPARVFQDKGFPIVAEEDGRFLVDAINHFLQDVHNKPSVGSSVPGALEYYYNEGGFQLDLKQSSIFRPSTRATPESTEVEALLTFVTDRPGEWAKKFLSDSTTLVVREHHSLSKLSEPGLSIRRADPRMGFLYRNRPPMSRWRLEKVNPGALESEVVKPIAVYLDAAMPESACEAARLGIGYWNKVFKNIGFKNAFMIQDLPSNADPLDPKFPLVVYFNPAQIVSQGYSVMDPRTKEKMRGVIFLAGYHEIFDRNLCRAIEPVLESGQPDLQTFIRLRNAFAIAHEAGHVLAELAHNDAVPSMMAMNRPRLRLGPSGGLVMDLSIIFPTEPFPYDEWMMRYAYTPFEPEEEDEGLRQIVEDGLREGLQFISQGARRRNPGGSPRIYCDDPLTVLEEDMAVRRLLIERFGPDMLHPGEPESLLFERFIPIYFYHRHSLRAAAIMLGGVESSYDPENDF